MLNRLSILALIGISTFLLLSSCANEEPLSGPNTKVTAETGDNVITISGMMESITPETQAELIKNSETIVFGKVTEILSSKWGTDASGHEVIYTDVVVNVDEYLFGEGSQKIAIRILGGRIDNNVTLTENEPIFTMNEQLVAFLYHPDQYFKFMPSPPNGIAQQDYYVVTKSTRGKWSFVSGKAIDYSNNSYDLNALNELISYHKQ